MVDYINSLFFFSSFMLMIQAFWMLYTTNDKTKIKNSYADEETLIRKNISTIFPSANKVINVENLFKKKLCIIFPSYKDLVDIDAWIKWSKGSETSYIIVEDVGNVNKIHENKDNVTVIKRDNRIGFKGGALNYVFDYMVSKKLEYDYVLIFDADHIPVKDININDIYKYLKSDIIQFFHSDGLPLKNWMDWLTYSSRYYSNWNIFNRSLANLTGAGMAIKYTCIKDGLRLPNSITEDYALTLDILCNNNKKVDVIPISISFGRSPANFKAFVRQQTRWGEGTIRDSSEKFFTIMKNKKISVDNKIDFFMHINIYLQGVWMYMSILTLSFLILIQDSNLEQYAVFSYMLVFQFYVYIKTLNKSPKRYIPLFFILNYFLGILQVYAFLRGIFIRNGFFVVTVKKGL